MSEATLSEQAGADAQEPQVQQSERPSWRDRLAAFRQAAPGISDLQQKVLVLSQERDAGLQMISQLRQERDAARAELAEVEQALAEQQQQVRASAAVIAMEVGQPLEALPGAMSAEAQEKKTPYQEWREAHDAGDFKRRDEIFAKHKDAIFMAHNARN